MAKRPPVRHRRRMVQAAHYVTWFLGTRFRDTVQLVFVLGFPKSGTTWACQLVADYMQLPFPRYSIMPVGCRAVVHGHELAAAKYPEGVYIVRDGRDAMASLYFAKLSEVPEGNRPTLTRVQRRLFPGLVNKQDHAKNFPPFLDQQLRHPFGTSAIWADHVRSYYAEKRPHMVIMRYEDLLTDGANTLATALGTLTDAEPDFERARATIEKYSFAMQSGRKSGQEDRSQFLRKGQSRDWENHFSRATAQHFDDRSGDMLIQAGYEPDHSWVDRCPG